MEHYFRYVVVFKSRNNINNGPIIEYADTKAAKANNSTMHLLDEDINEALLAIEYIMHLPRNVFDVHDINENLMGASYDTPHHIILLPDSEVFRLNIKNIVPAMFILTDDCGIEIKDYCIKINSFLGTYYVHDLNEQLIIKHWNELYCYKKLDEFKAVRDINVHFKLEDEKLKGLPLVFFNRQYGNINELMKELFNSVDIEKRCIDIQYRNKAHLNTLIELNNKGINFQDNNANTIYKEIYKTEASKLDISVVITFPGISNFQIKHGPNYGTLSKNEKRAIRILGVHRAIARGGILIELPCANEELFKKFDELEQRCKNGTNNRYVWKTITDLGKLLGSYFNSFQVEILKRAKDITVFSDFPVGLSILKGDEVPLQCYKEISYRPLTPLTRQLQIESLKTKQLYLGKKCKVAIAECIIDNEDNKYVYPTCELLHNSLVDMAKKYKGLSIEHNKTYTIDNIKKFIAENTDADILYISAHGHYDKNQNKAGIMVGNEFWMASEDIKIPPIVILSACHTSPRGIGAVNIADMFIRNGAISVLGTFIPVNAKRNLILMIRLFTYICEAQIGSDQYKTLNDVWSGVVATNAIHELMQTSENFGKWMHGKNRKGDYRIFDFQLKRCVGRLRASHVYSDTIKIIKEMLDEEGMVGKFGDILDRNNFFPESFFYQLIGYPENIFLYNEIFQKAYDKKIL